MTADTRAPLPPEFASPLGWLQTARLAYYMVLSDKTPSNNEIKNMHFMAYRKLRSSWKQRIWAEGLKGKIPTAPIQQSAIIVERSCVGVLDWDNALGGLKPLLDCLVTPKKANPDGLGVIVDDNPRNMPFPPLMFQVGGTRGEGSTRVWVFDLDSGQI